MERKLGLRRRWLVRLRVEGFFEAFATAVVALIFTRPGPVRATSAHRAIVMETVVFLFGGILGTLHHLCFTGTPTSVIAVGAGLPAAHALRLLRRPAPAPAGSIVAAES